VKQYYTDTYPGGTLLALEAIQKAINEGYISEDSTDPNYYDNYAVVFAQYPIRGTYNMIGALPNHRWYILSEQMGSEIYNPDETFTHIGLHLNSFGVDIGFYDLGFDVPINPTHTWNFDLMSTGWANGPLRKGECSATLAPYFRIEKEWIEPTTITNDTSNFIVEYDYDSSKIYRINPIDAPGNMHYLFEVRKREGFDLYVPEPPETYQNQPGTLLIWQNDVEFWFQNEIVIDKIRLKQADYSDESQLNDFFPSVGYNNYQSLNDTTLPAASLGDIFDEYYENYIRPAHFAINGIHKLGNGNTLIDEIKLNHAIIRNKISSGWKTVSVGAILSDYSASSVFPTAISSVYGYIPGQGYVVRTTLANGPGYWVNFGAAQTLVHTGLILDSLNIPVKSGWNLIGSISDKVPKLNICTKPPGLIVSMYFYDGGYNYLTNSDSLKPGRGYWLNAESDGNVILLRNYECPESEQFNIASMDKFIITDANGKTQDLYVANVDIDTTIADVDRSLPPPLPVIDFDARFNYGEFIKAVSVDSGEVDLEIDVLTNDYPITLSWEINPANGIEYSFISDSGLGKVSSLNKKLTFDENSNGKIKLFGKISSSFNSNLPERFELYQNYPNPFNPLTTIKYDIVKAQDVKVIVYDILGREVATLVNAQQRPGTYEVRWDASNVSSGIYFYQLKTKDYVDTKKMILLK